MNSEEQSPKSNASGTSVKINIKSESPQNEDVVIENVKITKMSRGINIFSVFNSSLLLIGVMLFGIAIASIGNDEYIKRHFYEMHFMNASNSSQNITGELFPAHIWSLGFLFPFGGLFGSLIGAAFIDKVGRKYPSFFFTLIAALGAIIKFASRNIHVGMLFLSRFLDGVACAGIMVAVVLLMLETIPPKLLKIFKPIIQISVNAGILMIGVASIYQFVQEDWNYVNFLPFILAIILAIAVIILPESPKYVYNKRKNDAETEAVLRKLRGKSYDKSELEDIKKQCQTSNIKQMTIIEFFKEKRFRLAYITMIMLNIGQQLCGINSIMAFAPRLLKNAGFDNPDVASVIIMTIGLVGSIIFSPIVSTLNRKTLWLIGFFGMFISFLGFIICQELNILGAYRVGFLCAFVFIFQIGPGPMVWFIAVEMFPPEAIGAAQGVGSFFNWFSNMLVYLLFPIVLAELKHFSLLIFMGFQLFIFIFSFIFLVETNKRSSKDILADYNNKINSWKIN